MSNMETEAEPEEGDWELCKENVQPLRQGRRVDNLAAAFQSNNQEQSSRLREERLIFEDELRTYSGDDPLDVWYRYIRWIEQNFPTGGKESHLLPVLERCTKTFHNVKHYHQDPRCLFIWIKFIGFCDSALDIYNYLFNQGICTELAELYETWAWELERIGNSKKADFIYSEGIRKGAQPLDWLQKRHSELQARVARRLAGELADLPAEPTQLSPSQRNALGELKLRGRKAAVGSNRASTTMPAPLHLSQGSNTGNKKNGFQVFCEDSSSSSSVLPAPSSSNRAPPSKKDNVENEMKAGVWTGARVKQKNVPKVQMSEVSRHIAPTFTVHEDEEAETPMIAKKPENPNPFGKLQHSLQMQQDNLTEKKEKVMYIKEKVYCGAEEYSFEEMRGARWREKKRAFDKLLWEDLYDASKKPMYCKCKVYTDCEEFSLEEIRARSWKKRCRNPSANNKKSSPAGPSSTEESISREDISSQLSSLSFKKLSGVESVASDLPSAGASVNGPSRTPDILQPSSILCKTPGETDRISSSFQAPPKPLPFSSVPAFHNKNNLSVSNKSHRETEECQSQVITSAGAISNESESGLLSRSGINTSSKATPSIHLTMNSSGSSSRSVKRTPTSGTSLLLERSSFCPSHLPSPTVHTREAIQAVQGMFSGDLGLPAATGGWEIQGVAATNMNSSNVTDFCLNESSAQPKQNLFVHPQTQFTIFEETEKDTGLSDRMEPTSKKDFITKQSEPFSIFQETEVKETYSSTKKSGFAARTPTVFEDDCKKQTSTPFTIFEDTSGNENDVKCEPHKITSSAPFTVFEDCSPIKSETSSVKQKTGIPEDICGPSIMKQKITEEDSSCRKPSMDLLPGVIVRPMPTMDEENTPYRDTLSTDDVTIAGAAYSIKLQASPDIDLGDMTFAPPVASTQNYTEMARMISTPFNPLGVAPLSAPPVSFIKPATPEKMAVTPESEEFTNDKDNSDKDKQEDNVAGRRSSIFPAVNLSTIMEGSDEAAKSGGSSVGSHHSDGHLTGTTHTTIHVSSHQTPHPSHSTTTNMEVSHPAECEQSHSHKLPECRQELEPALKRHRQKTSEGVDTSDMLASIKRMDTSEAEPQLEGRRKLRSASRRSMSFIGEKNCHEIDVSLYVPPQKQPDLNMSVAIDPHDPFDDELIAKFLSRLPVPITDYPSYYNIPKPLPQITEKMTSFSFGNKQYTELAQLGEGAYAKVYSATYLPVGSKNLDEEEYIVLKVQSPPCPWEFYITIELHRRLTDLNYEVDVRPSIMRVDTGYFFTDCSCLVSECHKLGTLLDFVNKHKIHEEKFHEIMQLLLTIEILYITEQMHNCQIIHGDIKPDNYLLRTIPLPCNNIDSIKNLIKGHTSHLKLIDFGRSIDMTMFPPQTTFTAKVDTSGFECIEMKTGAPWTYQTDLFGLAGTVYVIIKGSYMEVRQEGGRWRCSYNMRRNISCGALYDAFMDEMLNIPSCEDLPDLTGWRLQFEEALNHVSHAAIRSFPDYIQKLYNFMH